MKSKLLAILVVTIIVVGIAVTTATSGRADKGLAASGSVGVSSVEAIEPAKAVGSAPQQSADPQGTIDGEQNPELIPDHVAYLVMFQYIAERETDADKARAKDYIKGMGVGSDLSQSLVVTNNRVTRAVSSESADVDALIAAAEEHNTKIKRIDEDAKKINLKNERPTPNMLEKFEKVKQRKEGVTAEIVSSLPNRLTANGAQKVKKFVLEHVKQRVKIVPLPIPEAPGHAGHH